MMSTGCTFEPALAFGRGLMVATVFSLPTAMAPALLGVAPVVAQTDSGFELNEAELHKALQDLDSKKFRHRDSAFLALVRGGTSSIATLETGAQSSGAEVRRRSIEALLLIAREKENQSAVIAALERLASAENPLVAEIAEKHLADLSMSDKERALQALKSQGVRVYQQQNGDVSSVYVMRDKHLAWLKYFPKLQSVGISGLQVTDAGLSHLSGMRTLTSLSINQSRISDSGLAKLESLTNLRTISLRANEFTGRGLRNLGKIPNLIHVSLSSTVDDDDLLGLVNVRQINSLYISEISLTPSSVELLNRLTHLQQCNISMRDVEEQDLAWLADVQLPISLNLGGASKISNESWKHLRKSNLDSLSLSGVEISDQVLTGISQIESLKRLNLSGSMRVTEKGWSRFHESNLESLSLSGVKILGNTLAGIAQIKNLKHLNLNGSTAITGDGWQHLRDSNLQVLSVGGVPITDDDLVHFAAMKSLRNLHISASTNPITDAGLQHLKATSSLQSLYLRGSQVTEEAVETLKKEIESLRSVTLR